MKYWLLTILFFSTSVVANNYEEQLDYIESIRFHNIHKAKQLLNEFESEYSNLKAIEKARYLNLRAHSSLIQGEIKQAIKSANQVALVTNDFDQLARAKSLEASAFAMSGNYKDFFINVYDLLDRLDEVKSDDLRQAIISNALTRHTSARVFDRARNLANKMLAYGYRSDTKVFICNGYIELTRIEILSNNLHQANAAFKRAQSGCKNAKTPLIKNLIFFLDAQIDSLNGKYEVAKNKIELVQNDINENGWKGLVVVTEILMAKLYLELGALDEVEEFAMSAYSYAKSINDTESIKDASEVLAKYYSKTGNEIESNRFHQEFLKTSIEFHNQVESKRLAYYQAMNYRKSKAAYPK